MSDNLNENDDILFNLELQLEEDRTANIVVRENDDIEEVVEKFIQENNYDESLKQVIMDQILNVLENNIEDCKKIKFKISHV
jgi:uncharacterized protein YciU (UPF0263 family)